MADLELRTRHLLTLTAEIEPPQLTGATPAGARRVVPVVGGHFAGDRLRGRVLPGGSDWALGRDDDSLLLDVRLVLETDDGERLLMTYRGLRSGPPEVMARLARGEPVDPASYYFRTTPFFETASESPYGWLNRIVCVGVGERIPVGPRYTVFEVL